MGRDLSRKEFLSRTALLAAGAVLPRSAGATGSAAPGASQAKGSGVEADLIVVNARVFTSDPAQPRAEAFAVKDGRVLAVGRNADIRNVATARTRVFDAAGMTVTPGFIDAHCHPRGERVLFEVDGNLRSIAALKAAIAKKAAETPPGFWVNAYMFDDTKLSEGRPLHRRDLDEVAPNHPVSVNHRGGHTSWYNSAALRLAGVTRNTPDPEHGRFFRDADGEPNGRVAERARDVFASVGQRKRYTPDELRERARQGMRHMSRLLTASGLTTVHHMYAEQDDLTAYQDVRADGELRHRAYLMVGPNAYRQLRDAGVRTGMGDEWIRIGGTKRSADGSASERTMRMSTPYVGTDDYGILTMSQEEIHAEVDDAHSHGWQVGIHANGDVTIDMVLKAYERALARWPHPDRRHRIEHCSLVNSDLLRRIKATGTIPTPFWTYIYYHGEKWGEYGDDKMQHMFAHRSFLDAGIVVPGASDYGPGPFEPLMALQSMVTRRDFKGREWGANQKVTVDEALRIGTINGAHASYEEASKGSITAGKWADFVVLERDPHEVDPNTIKDIRIVQTTVGGKVVYPVGGA